MPGPNTPSRLRPALRATALSVALVAALAGPHAPVRAEGADSPLATELVLRALSLLGVNYRFGGSSPDTGLDCSGLVRHVFREAVGVALPRRADEISKAGEVIDRSQLRPGDLVFFNTLRRAFSHVGIYIGDGRFVHAPSRGGGVRIEHMDEQYWSKRFNGARRMLEDGTSVERLALERFVQQARPGEASGSVSR